MLTIRRIDGVRGFVPVSWSVFDENGFCLASFLKKSDALSFVNSNEEANK